MNALEAALPTASNSVSILTAGATKYNDSSTHHTAGDDNRMV